MGKDTPDLRSMTALLRLPDPRMTRSVEVRCYLPKVPHNKIRLWRAIISPFKHTGERWLPLILLSHRFNVTFERSLLRLFTANKQTRRQNKYKVTKKQNNNNNPPKNNNKQTKNKQKTKTNEKQKKTTKNKQTSKQTP